MYLLTENAVVLSDDGVNVKFKGKCPRCGKIDYAEHTLRVSSSGTQSSPHACHCGQGRYYSSMTRSSYYKDKF